MHPIRLSDQLYVVAKTNTAENHLDNIHHSVVLYRLASSLDVSYSCAEYLFQLMQTYWAFIECCPKGGCCIKYAGYLYIHKGVLWDCLSSQLEISRDLQGFTAGIGSPLTWRSHHNCKLGKKWILISLTNIREIKVEM